METPTLLQRSLSRGDFLTGMAGSIVTHVIVFGLAFVAPWASSRQPAMPAAYTVNLVSMQDFSPPAAAPKKGTTSKGAEGASSSASQRSASVAKAAPVVPVKRLQLDEPPVTRPEREIKKLDAPEIPKVVEPTPQRKASVEKDLESLIPKPKAPPKPKPIQQEPVEESPRASASTQQTRSTQTDAASEARSARVEKGSGGVGPGGVEGTPKGVPEGAGRSGSGTNPKGTAEGTGAGGGAPGGSIDGVQLNNARRAYYAAIMSAVRRNWALPEFLKAQQLEARIAVVIRRDGKVLDLRIEKGSGNNLYDESAKRAVRKAEPLPPFPEVYSVPQEEVVLRFTPEMLS